MTKTEIGYWDHQGKPISADKWSRMFAQYKYRVVRFDSLRGKWISTIWMGIDNCEWGDPLIFETLVRRRTGDELPLFTLRHSTKEQALAYHEEVLDEIRTSDPPPSISVPEWHGDKCYGTCSDCGKLVQLNKRMFGSMHVCA